MKTRIISSLIMLPLAVFVYLGGLPLFVFAMAIALISMYEFYNGYRNIDVQANRPLGYILMLVLYVILAVNGFSGRFTPLMFSRMLTLWVFLTIALSLVSSVFSVRHKITDGLATMAGVLYPGFFTSHVVMTENLEACSILVWLAVITAFGTDTFAYFAGVALGKHKLCPDISPKKTVEGSVGGILGSTVLCWIFGMLFAKQWLSACIVIGLLGSVAAQAGDLTASAFKRNMGIKDFGNLIPGHGGVLDRFDSILFTAPFVYYYAIIILQA
jgi:phosphatidate cytidylyltransferase